MSEITNINRSNFNVSLVHSVLQDVSVTNLVYLSIHRSIQPVADTGLTKRGNNWI